MAGKKGRSGRKPLEFDLVAVEGLGGLDCTYEELASFPVAICPKCGGKKNERNCECERDKDGYNIGRTTVSKILIEKLMMNHDSDFYKAYKKGNGNKKISLRRQMYQAAAEGNIGMMIFLAKNRLGMTDYNVQIDININALAAQLNMSESEFLRARDKIARGEIDFSEVKVIEGESDEKE